MTQLNDKDNLILQTFASIIMLVELQTQNFTQSDYFKSLQFQNTGIKKVIESIGVGNQGVLLMSLYGMLVLPRELNLQIEFPDEYKTVNDFTKSKATNVSSNYASDNPEIDFLRHIRNAVAHSKITMEGTDFLIKDENTRKGETFACKISRENIGGVVHLLQHPFLKYSQRLQLNQNN